MPRILHLFNTFGAVTEKALLDYTLGLSRGGFDLTIGYEQLAPEAAINRLPCVPLQRISVEPTSDVPGQMRRVAEGITDPAMLDLLTRPFDLVHGHFGPRILQGAAWLARGVPMIVSVYGYDVGRLLRDPCWIERYRWAADRGATFVVLARFMEEKLLALGLPRERVRRIHLGIDLAEHLYDPRPAPRIPRFVFVGRFVDKKGADVLVDAMAHLTGPLGVAASLDLIGGGPNDAALRAQVNRLGMSDRVNFVGKVPFTKLFDYLRDCTAMVQPSVVAPDGDSEGAPMVLMSAQACGVPCITTRHSGNPETIPPNAHRFVVAERDAVALALAMKRTIELSGDRRAALKIDGRKWIEEHFNLERTVEQYAALYAELIAGRSRKW